MKNLLKKLIVGLLVSGTLMSTTVFASDLSEWAKPEYNLANEYALIPYSVISQDMSDYITRVEFCDLVMNTYQKMTNETLIIPTKLPFKDTDSLAVSQAYYYGIVQGDENQLFHPTNNITREEMAKILLNLLIATETDFKMSISTNEDFEDSKNISDWSKLAMSTAINNDILQGIDDYIEPKSFSTRQQAVIAVARLYDKYSTNISYNVQPEPYIKETEDSIIINWQSIYKADKYVLLIKDKNNQIMHTEETTEKYINISKNFFKLSPSFSVIIGSVNYQKGIVYSLPIDYKIDSLETISTNYTIKENTVVNNIINTAQCYLGTPYVWGGATPSGFDCSGFVQYIYGQNGYTLTRTTYTQWANDGSYVSRENLQPGDLVYFGKNGSPTHVGLYVGDGKMIHSPQTGDVVKYTPIDTGYYSNRFIGGKRII